MNRRSLCVIVACGTLIGGGLTTALVQARSAHRRLAAERLRLEDFDLRRAGLEHENERLRAESKAMPELAQLHSEGGRLYGRNFAADSLAIEDGQFRRLLGVKSDPVWLPGFPVHKAEDWSFAGRSSPEGVLQSVLWAGRRGDLDALSELLAIEGEARTDAAKLFAELPEESRSQYGSVERLTAALVTAQMPDDYQAFAAMPLADLHNGVAALNARIETSDGSQSQMALYFTQDSGGGWRLNVPDRVVQQFASQLKK